ncbi:MAG TPA: hypothetical protein DDW50_17755 [Firmicutes bacterium]|nr:hypothetical protein [Bacillota bacterium]
MVWEIDDKKRFIQSVNENSILKRGYPNGSFGEIELKKFDHWSFTVYFMQKTISAKLKGQIGLLKA